MKQTKLDTPDELPAFGNRVITHYNEIHHKPFNIQDTIRLLALTSPWELDLLMEKGILQREKKDSGGE